MEKCPVCKTSQYPLTTINGHSCCSLCDGEFCYGCGSYPVELSDNSSLCTDCRSKRTVLQIFGSAAWLDQTQVFTEADAKREIDRLIMAWVHGELTGDEYDVVSELWCAGHWPDEEAERRRKQWLIL